jgi:hypothetical protein
MSTVTSHYGSDGIVERILAATLDANANTLVGRARHQARMGLTFAQVHPEQRTMAGFATGSTR